MKKFYAIACLIFIANPLSAETFSNTNDDQNGKSFGQLMSWVFDGEKSPDKIEIETSDQWQDSKRGRGILRSLDWACYIPD